MPPPPQRSSRSWRTASRSGEPTALLLGGRALREPALRGRRPHRRGDRREGVRRDVPGPLERGAGLPPVERLAYLAEFAAVQLGGLKHLVLVDAKAPVSFFAYPGKESYLVPDGCEVHVLAARQ